MSNAAERAHARSGAIRAGSGKWARGAAVEAWARLAREAELDERRIERIRRDHRLRLPRR